MTIKSIMLLKEKLQKLTKLETVKFQSMKVIQSEPLFNLGCMHASYTLTWAVTSPEGEVVTKQLCVVPTPLSTIS